MSKKTTLQIFSPLLIIALIAITIFALYRPTTNVDINPLFRSRSGVQNTFDSAAAADLSAYRWNAMAKFYDARNESQSSLTGDLSTYDAAEASVYRWQAMAKFYDARNESQSSLTGDLSTYDAAEASVYRWQAMAKFYEARN